MSFVFDASSIFEAMLHGKVRVLSGNYTVDLTRYELGNVLWKRRALLGDLSEEELTIHDASYLCLHEGGLRARD